MEKYSAIDTILSGIGGDILSIGCGLCPMEYLGINPALLMARISNLCMSK
jgi:hypothetical protein